MWPSYDDRHRAEVGRVLESGKLTYWAGTEGRHLEAEYAAALGRRHAVAVANGTLALELGLRAFGIGHGDEVIVPARTFIATASAVVAVGATPVVADVERDSGVVTVDTVRFALTPRTRAVIPVHLGGWPVDMVPILDLAEKRGLVVIEDCAQAHGGALPFGPIGSGRSHGATFSFCGDKIVPAGEGGVLVLDDDDAFERAWSYKDHGKSLEALTPPPAGSGPSFRWLVESFGSNWRLPELSAALVRVGLDLLPRWHSTRTGNAERIIAALTDTPGLRVPSPKTGFEHAFYRLYAHVEPSALATGWDRDRITAAITAEGIACQHGSCGEIYREQAFVRAGLGPAARLPVAAELNDTSIAFFVHPTLGIRDIDDTVEAVRRVMEVAAG
jgi:dTDP-4-amino-4,6-dideoxygalactose transaminase